MGTGICTGIGGGAGGGAGCTAAGGALVVDGDGPRVKAINAAVAIPPAPAAKTSAIHAARLRLRGLITLSADSPAARPVVVMFGELGNRHPALAGSGSSFAADFAAASCESMSVGGTGCL